MRRFLCGVLRAGAVFAQESAHLLPNDDEIPGWVRDGAPQRAQGPQELCGLRDGPAVAPLQRAFTERASQGYAGTIGGHPALLQAVVFDCGTAGPPREGSPAAVTASDPPWDGEAEDAWIDCCPEVARACRTFPVPVVHRPRSLDEDPPPRTAPSWLEEHARDAAGRLQGSAHCGAWGESSSRGRVEACP